MITLTAFKGTFPDLQFFACVVGSGPVGLAVATELAKAGKRVLVLEAGNVAASPSSIIQKRLHVEPKIANLRGFGGNDAQWGGRCVPFDPQDFEARPVTRQQDWPIKHGEIAPFYDGAAAYLGLTSWPDQQVSKALRKSDQRASEFNGIRMDAKETWLRDPRIGKRVLAMRCPGEIIVLENAAVSELVLDEGKLNVKVKTPKASAVIFSLFDKLVLACGGLENTRLLLLLRRRNPGLNPLNVCPLGQTYMGHLSGQIATIQFRNASDARHFDYFRTAKDRVRYRLQLSSSIQKTEALPNVAFWPTNPKIGDATHKSGLLSLIYLGMSMPLLGRALVPESLRRLQIVEKPDYRAHFSNLMRNPLSVLSGVWNLLGQVIFEGRKKPLLFLYSTAGKYPLHFHSEHMPSLASRVSLSEPAIDNQEPTLEIDIHFDESDGSGIAKSHLILDQQLRQSNLAELQFSNGESEVGILAQLVLKQASDGYSQIGLTRMGNSPETSVVNKNCEVHGITNLFVAGSSVFCTSSQANPTFLAVAMAMRLASHMMGKET